MIFQDLERVRDTSRRSFGKGVRGWVVRSSIASWLSSRRRRTRRSPCVSTRPLETLFRLIMGTSGTFSRLSSLYLT